MRSTSEEKFSSSPPSLPIPSTTKPGRALARHAARRSRRAARRRRPPPPAPGRRRPAPTAPPPPRGWCPSRSRALPAATSRAGRTGAGRACSGRQIARRRAGGAHLGQHPLPRLALAQPGIGQQRRQLPRIAQQQVGQVAAVGQDRRQQPAAILRIGDRPARPRGSARGRAPAPSGSGPAATSSEIRAALRTAFRLLRLDPDRDHRDVVQAACGVGHLDQAFAQAVEVGLVGHHVGHLRCR